MAKRVRSLRCPNCRKIVLRNEPEFPFCSKRCRLIDLGKWASGAYVVSTPIADPELISESDLPRNTEGPKDPQTHFHGKERKRY